MVSWHTRVPNRLAWPAQPGTGGRAQGKPRSWGLKALGRAGWHGRGSPLQPTHSYSLVNFRGTHTNDLKKTPWHPTAEQLRGQGKARGGRLTGRLPATAREQTGCRWGERQTLNGFSVCLQWTEGCGATVPILYGTRDRFHGRQFFHGPGYGDGFGTILAYCSYCAFYCYYYYIGPTSDHQALDPGGWGPLLPMQDTSPSTMSVRALKQTGPWDWGEKGVSQVWDSPGSHQTWPWATPDSTRHPWMGFNASF